MIMSPTDDVNKGYSTAILLTSPEQASKYTCYLCHGVFRDPIQSDCGHRFCRACFNVFLRIQPIQPCPLCQAEPDAKAESFILNEIFEDKAFKRECDKLLVRCEYHTLCSWQGRLDQYSTHLSTSCTGIVANKCSLGCEIGVHHNEIEKHNTEFMTEHVEYLFKRLTALEETCAIKQHGAAVSNAARFNKAENGQIMCNGNAVEHLPDVLPVNQLQQLPNVCLVLNQQFIRCLSEIDEWKTKCREYEKRVAQLEAENNKINDQLRIKDLTLADQDMRIQSLEGASYDGVLLWKITNFSQRRREAIELRSNSIYSPPFFTSRSGYKLCARIYLNGDGMGKGTHISLFIVIMKGSFDALLPWPFRQKITLTILDLGGRDHVVDAFQPDVASSSFKRPTSDMNIASGCPLFMPLSYLEMSGRQYVKDDCLYVKVVVDTRDLNCI